MHSMPKSFSSKEVPDILLVHIEKTRGFNSVNLHLDYSLLDIQTLKEMG